jgi:hypothetical protein
MSAPHVNIVPLLDMYLLHLLFAGSLAYLERRTVFLIIFYNKLQLLLLLLLLLLLFILLLLLHVYILYA